MDAPKLVSERLATRVCAAASAESSVPVSVLGTLILKSVAMLSDCECNSESLSNRPEAELTETGGTWGTRA